jgi:4-diphosphocytidyl-2-C-methyl-D-erythritol kinase
MATRVRSYSKINLGLAIGPVRTDGYHGLLTLYQTLALCDFVTVTARRLEGAPPPGISGSRISLTTNHPFVPRDGRNTAWKMVEKALARLGGASGPMQAEVAIHIEKNLPVQGGMGAGSANAAAALLGLERELGVTLSESERLELAGEVGSDVPLFLVGGAVLGTGRGELLEAMPDLPRTVCLVVVPGMGVSTPTAFKAWDAKRARISGSDELAAGVGAALAVGSGGLESGVSAESGTSGALAAPSGGSGEAGPGVEEAGSVVGVGLTSEPLPDTLAELSRVYASAFSSFRSKADAIRPSPSGIVPSNDSMDEVEDPEGLHSESDQSGSGGSLISLENDLAENILLSLVRTGVENGLSNDFESVVFPEYPSLRELKQLLMGIETGAPALYAALSGSGSALFGLYASVADAEAAQQRVEERVQARGFEFGVRSFITETLPRAEYWARMFAG